MPKDLAALLVEDGAVPTDVVERAVARQREAGGALDTALLEQGAIGEEALVAYLARAAGLPAAPGWAFSGGDLGARRVFPSGVAERHSLAPFALDGRELSLVAAYPLDLALLDEISFMLSLHLNTHVAPEWRVRELIHRLYGIPLPPRLAALAGAASAAPTAASRGAPAEPDTAVRGERPPPVPAGFARDESGPLEPLAAALAQALEDVESFSFGDLPSEPEGADAEPEDRAEPDAAAEEARPPDRTAPPRWSLDDARAALAAARDRDEVVLVALRYARDFFEFAAMFAVARDAVAGHDALGAEEARDRARSVAIWASDPGMFKTVLETRSPYLGPVGWGAAGTDAILHGLGRTPRTALVYPVFLRDRPVCILYAYNGDAPVSPRRLADLLVLLSTVGPSFGRILRARKSRRSGHGAVRADAAAPASEQRAAQAPGVSAASDESANREPAASGAASGGAAPLPNAAPEAMASARPIPDEAADANAPVAPDAVTLAALAERALDADAAMAGAACAALERRRRDPAMRQAAEKLRRALLSGISARASRAARALGALRDVEAIPLLIQVLDTTEPETTRAAADALAAITLQRLGPDARRWLAWWKENRGSGRAQWLFSGLTSADRETRVAASIELSLAAPPPVSYSADMPAAEREEAARAWAGWWARSGNVL